MLDKSQLIEVKAAVEKHMLKRGLVIAFKPAKFDGMQGEFVLFRVKTDKDLNPRPETKEPIATSVSYSALVEMALSFKYPEEI